MNDRIHVEVNGRGRVIYMTACFSSFSRKTSLFRQLKITLFIHFQQ